MVFSEWHLNRFERILFSVALGVAVLLVAVRIGAVLIIPYLKHSR
jgi:hypothetical protein